MFLISDVDYGLGGQSQSGPVNNAGDISAQVCAQTKTGALFVPSLL